MSFELTLARIRLHPVVIVWKITRTLLGLLVWVLVLLIMGALSWIPAPVVIGLITLGCLLTALLIRTTRRLWEKSYLTITNRRMYVEIHKSPFRTYSTDIYFHNMRDTAYSYHTVLGNLFKYGTLFCRNGSENDGAQGLVVNKLPEPDVVRDYISYLTAIEPEKRLNALKYEDFYRQQRPERSAKSEDDMRKKILHLLQQTRGITGVSYLTEGDRDVIWAKEELRNMGVFQTLLCRHVVVATHDAALRPPAGDIVAQRGDRIVFPGVPFPEVPRPNVVSCSPGQEVHEYLTTRIAVKGEDATLLIGWN